MSKPVQVKCRYPTFLISVTKLPTAKSCHKSLDSYSSHMPTKANLAVKWPIFAHQTHICPKPIFIKPKSILSLQPKFVQTHIVMG